LRREAVAAAGCDVGGTAIKVVLLRGRTAARSFEVPAPGKGTREEAIDAIAASVRAVVPPRTRGPARLPVGVAVPGFLDAARRRVVRLSNLPRLDGAPLKAALERRLGTSVVLDADTNAGAVAEARLGAGRGRERVLYVTAGTGLGAALAVRGEPIRVSRHTVGQVAHIPLDPSGLSCRCGARGCAEALLGARGMVRRARRMGLPARSPADLHRMASRAWPSRKEAAIARSLWRETGDLLGALLRVLTAFLSPDIVVVGGGLAGSADLFLPSARRRLCRRGAAVVPAALGRFAGAIGMALLARDHSSKSAR
jgi:glucokinase